MLVSLATDLMPPAATVLTATVTLLVLGVIDEPQALSGFSNAAPLTVAALYVLAYAADKTGLLGPMVNRMLGKEGKVTPLSLARLTVPTAGVSAFINNTPLVAMLIGQVTSWCDQRGVSPSKLLLPISYAALLGGTLTVIGTSTNLVASGLLQNSGDDPIGMFEITKVSFISVILGMLVADLHQHPADPRTAGGQPGVRRRDARVHGPDGSRRGRPDGRHDDRRSRPAQPQGRVPGRDPARRRRAARRSPPAGGSPAATG